jgi:hypothetical protein
MSGAVPLQRQLYRYMFCNMPKCVNVVRMEERNINNEALDYDLK